MGVLDHAVKRKERTVVGHNRIIITDDKETSAWCRVARLGRWVYDLLTLSFFLKPEVVRPNGPEAVAQSLLNGSVSLLAYVIIVKPQGYVHLSIGLVSVIARNPPADQTHKVRSYHRTPMVEAALEESWFQKKVEAQPSLSSLVHNQCAPAAVKEGVQLDLSGCVVAGGHCLEYGKPERPVHYSVLVTVVLFVSDHDDESLLEKVTECVTGTVVVYRDLACLRL